VTGVLVIAVASGAFALVSIVVGVIRDGDSLLYGNTLRVPVQLSREALHLPAGVHPHGTPVVDVEIPDPTTAQMLARSVMDVAPLALIVAGLWLGRGFLSSVREGDPFGGANVQRLRALGFILLVGAPLVELLRAALRQGLLEDLPPHPSVDLGVPGFSLPGNAMVAGLVAFILAEVFAFGLRLREDVEATI
jgi:hypothetical protein